MGAPLARSPPYAGDGGHGAVQSLERGEPGVCMRSETRDQQIMASIRIAIVDDHPTIIFAAAELQRCLAQATGQPVDVLDHDAISRETPALWLGLARHFPGVALPPAQIGARSACTGVSSVG